MPATRLWHHRLFHILDAIAAIRSRLLGVAWEEFRMNAEKIGGIERRLQVISEAVRFVPEHDRCRFPLVPWKQVADFGNVSRHEYDAVDPERLWNVATGELEALEAACMALYLEHRRPTDPAPPGLALEPTEDLEK